MRSFIALNAAKLQEMEAEVKKRVKRRQEGFAQMEAWSEACRRFFASYDALAFPGGLSNALSLLPQNDVRTIEMVVQFLEVDPWFFRSGYIKEKLIKHLRRAPLTDDQRKRLQQVILNRIKGHDVREFRWYCRLAPHVADPDFEQKVRELTASNVPLISRHAQWIFAQITPLVKRSGPGH